MSASPARVKVRVIAPHDPAMGAQPGRNDRVAFAGVLAATFLTYASTIPFGWVYDDPPQIPNNPDLYWGRLGYLFSHHLWASMPGVEARFYRPLLSLWFLLNKTIFGLNPQGFHLTTVLTHVAATALAYCVAKRLLSSSPAALVVAAIFGFHPLHVETAAWISDVDDSLAAILCFGAFLAYCNARQQPIKARVWWAVSLACYAAGLLTKESVLLLPLIIFLDACMRPLAGRIRTAAVIVISYGAVALAYLAIRSAVLGSWAAVQHGIPAGDAWLAVPRLLCFYLQSIVLPIGLSSHYEPVRVAGFYADFWLAVAVLIVIVAGMITLWRTWPKETKETSTHSSIVALAAAWLLIPLWPALDLRVLVDRDPLHDRYAYLSVFGGALLLAATWQAFHDRWAPAKIARPLFIAAAVAMAFASAIQSQYWANDSALFARSVAIAPSNPWAHWNYGTALNDRGKYAEAEAEFARAYELVPDDRMAAYAGSAAERIERWPDAEQWFRRSIELNQKNAETWFDLGHVLLAEHRAAEAIPALERAIQLAPAAAGYHYDLAAALEQSGRTAEARDQYRAELSIHPEQTGAQQALERLAPALLKSH